MERTLHQFGVGREREYPHATTVQALIDARIQVRPDAVALVHRQRRMTYRELGIASSEAAMHLRSAGAMPGTLVGLCLNRSLEMVIWLLAVLKCGAAYVPMDPAFPRDRLGAMMADAGIPILVTESSLANRLPPHAAQVVWVDKPALNDGVDRAELTGGGNMLRDTAYVIFTSGSTGRPKGVQIPQRALINFLESMRREPGMDADDVLLAVTTPSFDIAGLELLLPLVAGGRVVIATREATMDGTALIRLLEDHAVTVLQATPATWRLMLEAGWKGSPRLKALCGGEALPPSLAAELLKRCGELWNMYGPTETTIWSTCGRILDANDISIGRPIDNTEVRVVDHTFGCVPVGVTGELMIGGDGLAVGYLNRPELTAERFVMDPGRPGKRLYRTGDLARWRPDGTLECLGRMDSQVKIRGHRIELGEIETVLVTHEKVGEAVVTSQRRGTGDSHLVAHVVRRGNFDPSSDELREHLARRLPAYMIPSAFKVINKLPLTPNGKVDRKALSDGVAAEKCSSRPVVAPGSTAEARLMDLFGELLGVKRIGVNDDFFELGGDSVTAARLLSKIQDQFGVRLPLSTLLSSSTVKALAHELSDWAEDGSGWDCLVPIRPGRGRPTLFLVHGASGNLLLYRALAEALAPDISVYGFQARGLDGKSAPFRTIEEMASHYVRRLRHVQPSGKYHLAGYCMGGAVVYEMARQIAASGEVPGFLGLFDSYNLGSLSKEGKHRPGWSALWQKAAFHFQSLREMSTGEVVEYLGEKLRMAAEAARGRVRSGLAGMGGAREGNQWAPKSGGFVQRINDEAAWRYLPPPSQLQLTLFRPRANYDYLREENMGWSEAVGERIELMQMAANPHAMLLKPHVVELAGKIKELILADDLTEQREISG